MAEQAKDDKPFLSRWSERKRAVQAEEAAEEHAPAPDAHAEARAAEEQAEHDANRAAAEAIDLETLDDASDYAPFFKPGVPAALKHAALRKLWRSNPVFAVLDGLNDYDLDYTWPKSGSEVVKTAWQVGRGFLSGEDKGAAAAEGAGKPAEDPVAVRAPAEPEEGAGEAGAEVPLTAAQADSTESAADAAESPQSEAEPEPEADEPEPVKVSLSRRLDFAAFAKEDGGQ